jgi:hypothetical protein
MTLVAKSDVPTHFGDLLLRCDQQRLGSLDSYLREVAGKGATHYVLEQSGKAGTAHIHDGSCAIETERFVVVAINIVLKRPQPQKTLLLVVNCLAWAD